jgi:hypothetical protein
VRSSFANQGEICLCGSRIFVQKGIYDKFVQQFVEAAKQIKVHNLVCVCVCVCVVAEAHYVSKMNVQVGDPKDPSSTMGALVSQEHLAKVNYYIDLAREEGGSIALGGDKPPLPDELSKGTRRAIRKTYHNATRANQLQNVDDCAAAATQATGSTRPSSPTSPTPAESSRRRSSARWCVPCARLGLDCLLCGGGGGDLTQAGGALCRSL